LLVEQFFEGEAHVIAPEVYAIGVLIAGAGKEARQAKGQYFNKKPHVSQQRYTINRNAMSLPVTNLKPKNNGVKGPADLLPGLMADSFP